MSDQEYLFLSHGVRDYGRPITDSVIREIIDRLRPALSPRWSKKATPHTLRHACAYQLQGRVSHDVIMTQMQHLSTRSLDPTALRHWLLPISCCQPSVTRCES